MPTTTIYPPGERSKQSSTIAPSDNPLPHLLQTPSGLAIIELQGTINLPLAALDAIQRDIEAGNHGRDAQRLETPIGQLIFPDYHGEATREGGDEKWMKRVYLYVGQNQRMTGEVKAIPKPLAVLRRVNRSFDEDGDVDMQGNASGDRSGRSAEELEIVDIIKYRIYFKSRPEPVSGPMAV